MTNESQTPHRVFVHDQESAPANPERVEARAKQLAAGHGRGENEVTDADRELASKELQEEEGLGVPDAGTVEKRAKEIALINSRDPGDVTDADRDQARRELQGMGPDEIREESLPRDRVPRNPAEPPRRSGSKVPRKESPDEALEPEREAEEGMREAVHDNMLTDRRQPRERES